MPVFIQMPIFFALYKVLYISIDMRHAPFFGWIKDLSAPDPMLVTNLFGLIPWEPTGFLALGVLPILMGVTMWLQQKMSPQTSADPMQQKIFAMLPIVFTFVLAGFAVGLVIYWTWNNILTITQQWLIMNKLQKEKDAPKQKKA
jgi:YidC/Oxa1 family membrane protein insertase